jgi:hypothetical protein
MELGGGVLLMVLAGAMDVPSNDRVRVTPTQSRRECVFLVFIRLFLYGYRVLCRFIHLTGRDKALVSARCNYKRCCRIAQGMRSMLGVFPAGRPMCCKGFTPRLTGFDKREHSAFIRREYESVLQVRRVFS